MIAGRSNAYILSIPYSKSLWNSTSIGSAMWHFDVINFLLEKIHIHPAPRGATGPRTPPPLNA